VAGYTKLNLKSDVEDLAKKGGLPEEMEARFPGGDLESEQLSISHQRYGPNFRQPFGHTHKTQEEVYVVLDGGGKMALGDEVIDVAQGDAIRVSPETPRCFEGGANGIEILAVGASPSGESARGDAEQMPGWWPE
jgi:mannose-6-phosphate isomerase-like protein (cupin superfamily)